MIEKEEGKESERERDRKSEREREREKRARERVFDKLLCTVHAKAISILITHLSRQHLGSDKTDMGVP